MHIGGISRQPVEVDSATGPGARHHLAMHIGGISRQPVEVDSTTGTGAVGRSRARLSGRELDVTPRCTSAGSATGWSTVDDAAGAGAVGRSRERLSGRELDVTPRCTSAGSATSWSTVDDAAGAGAVGRPGASLAEDVIRFARKPVDAADVHRHATSRSGAEQVHHLDGLPLPTMPAEFIYTSYKLARHYPPDRTVLEDISISFYPGAKIGVIGSNGAGKSSLLRIMAGLDDGFTGDARLTPGFTVGFLSQEPQLDPGKDVKGNVLDGVREVHGLIEQYNAVMAKWSEPDADYEAVGAEQSALEDRINAADAWNLERNVDIAMDALRCPPDDADVSVLSGGEKRRVALARLLLQHPDLLLLDEPTNHLDAESVEWLERFLGEYAGTVVAVTHDRYFLDNVAKWILELDRGRGIPFSGNYSSWLEQKLERLSRETKTADARQRTLARELAWVRLSPKARQAKGKARLSAYEQLLAEATDAKGSARELEIAIPPGPRLGDQVIDVNGLRKGYGDRLLIEDLTFSLPRSGIVGIIGPNGAGKTTLFRMLVGQEPPDAGSITVGDTVVMSYVDQSRDDLEADKSVFEEITQGVEVVKVGNRELPARAYVSSFNFRGTDQQKLVGQLSGGERNRVHLAKLLQSGGNVLLLDEPTNDLDVDTLRALEAGLESFPGCVVVISHDRWFLDRIATHILAFEGDSQVRFFEGNVSDYEAFRHKELGTAADQPHRIKYKRLAA
jgi:ATP-binding cassette ChvD family protein